jgi:Xaa-Pro aminopeptidase
VHAARRAHVLAALGGGQRGALVLPAAPELFVGNDGELRYLPDADLYYLAGYPEPEAVLVLCPSAESPFTLFVRPRDAEREQWTGVRGGVDAARERYGADAAWALDQLDAELPRLTAGADVLYAPFASGRPAVDAAIGRVLAAARRSRPRTGRGPHTHADPRVLLAPMRLRKDEHEQQLIREAAGLTARAFAEAARVVTRAAGEWQVEAAVEHVFRREGAAGPAFATIAAGGANATVLHYVQNDAPLTPGDLLLVDAGARYRMYCSDISRTWPVSGRFTDAQRAVYEIVRRAHDVAVAEIAPGRGAADMHRAAVRVLAEGMIGLGLLDGTVDDAIARGDYRRYYPHRTSHWLGLDVHDVGDYVDAAGADARLEPGMVLTVEPGLYIPPDDAAAPPALRGVGIRLEDDVVVTAGGHDVLTAGLPMEPDEVEAMLA